MRHVASGISSDVSPIFDKKSAAAHASFAYLKFSSVCSRSESEVLPSIRSFPIHNIRGLALDAAGTAAGTPSEAILINSVTISVS